MIDDGPTPANHDLHDLATAYTLATGGRVVVVDRDDEAGLGGEGLAAIYRYAS